MKRGIGSAEIKSDKKSILKIMLIIAIVLFLSAIISAFYNQKVYFGPVTCKNQNLLPYYGADTDKDGVKDICPDNCPTVYNPYQQNYDSDGVGDVCDKYKYTNYYSQGKDKDNDGIPDAEDPKPYVWTVYSTTSPSPSPTVTASPSPSDSVS